jgi:IS5 family transposase
MSQLNFSDFEYAGKRKQTRRERFLAEMDQVVPWSGLLALIEPYYPKAGGGRKPYPLENMLRIHLFQSWFSLSDPAIEDVLYEITPMRQFARLPLNAPDLIVVFRASGRWERSESHCTMSYAPGED